MHKKDFNPQRRDTRDFIYPARPSVSFVDRAKWGIQSLITSAEPTLLAVDLSHWNGSVDFAALRASGVQAVILKCSEGAEGTYYEYKDTKFEEYWPAALDEGFPTMTYHFWRDNKGSMEKNWYMKCADNFLQAVDGHTACWCDVEWRNTAITKSTRANRVFGFNDLIKAEDIRQGVYCSPGLVDELFPAVEPRWANVWQWDAHWTGAPAPTLPRGWSWDRMKAWQKGISPTHSWVPVIQGTSGAVDVNYLYFASEEELRTWLGETPTPPPVDCCDDHELRIATLEAGQQVLTDIQVAQALSLAAMSEKLDVHTVQIGEMEVRIEQLYERVNELEAQMARIKSALCDE